MDMAQISRCSMEDCAYNKDGLYHTLAITVGLYAECNTFVHASGKGGFDEVKGGEH